MFNLQWLVAGILAVAGLQIWRFLIFLMEQHFQVVSEWWTFQTLQIRAPILNLIGAS